MANGLGRVFRVRRPLRATGLAVPAAVSLGAPRGWVAVCTLAERGLAARVALCARLSRAARPAVALAGPLLSLPRGLERLVANLASRPTIQTLLVCGRNPRGVPAREALCRLWAAGLTPARRILGVRGVDPLRNIDARALSLVRSRVRLTDLGPTHHVKRILGAAASLSRPRGKRPPRLPRRATILAPPIRPRAHGLDPAGYFVILAPTSDGRICCEHYRRDGALTRRFLSWDAAGLCRAILRRRLPGSVEHAAYLGRELQKAEDALRAGLPYSQDDPLPFPRRLAGKPSRRPPVRGRR